MKKSNFLKIALTLVMAFVVSGLMAQTYPAAIETDYVDATEATYQTIGYGLTLYVAPDPAFSPDYDGDGAPAYNASSLWTWTVGGTPQVATANNYVQIAAGDLPAAGADLVVGVVESITGITCAGTPAANQTITVIGVPNADIAVTPVGDWAVVAANEYQTCTDAQSEDIDITFTETAVPGGYAFYAYKLDITKTDYDSEGVAGVPSTSSVGPAIDGTLEASSTAQTISFDLTGGAARTEYVIALQTGSIGSQISRVSQYRANSAAAYVYNDPAATTFTFWVSAPPTTGPIYHIPNNFSGF
jgi:hypothetical protein